MRSRKERRGRREQSHEGIINEMHAAEKRLNRAVPACDSVIREIRVKARRGPSATTAARAVSPKRHQSFPEPFTVAAH